MINAYIVVWPVLEVLKEYICISLNKTSNVKGHF